jgi:hypothetical protein
MKSIESHTILTAIQQELDQRKEQLVSRGLSWRGPVLVDRAVEGSEPTVELELWFYQGKEPIDFVEFFVWRNGKLVATAQEVRTWFQDVLSDILRRTRASGDQRR